MPTQSQGMVEGKDMPPLLSAAWSGETRCTPAAWALSEQKDSIAGDTHSGMCKRTSPQRTNLAALQTTHLE